MEQKKDGEVEDMVSPFERHGLRFERNNGTSVFSSTLLVILVNLCHAVMICFLLSLIILREN